MKSNGIEPLFLYRLHDAFDEAVILWLGKSRNNTELVKIDHGENVDAVAVYHGKDGFDEILCYIKFVPDDFPKLPPLPNPYRLWKGGKRWLLYSLSWLLLLPLS